MIQNNQIVVSSRDIAEHFEKRHDHIMRDIKNLLEGIPKTGDTQPMFFESTYINEQNKQEYSEYLMNRDGFSLLVMGFTGQKALEWKLKYIAAFNAMEEELKKQQIQSKTPNELILMLAQANVEQDKKIQTLEETANQHEQQLKQLKSEVTINALNQIEDTAELKKRTTEQYGEITATKIAVQDVQHQMDSFKRATIPTRDFKEVVHYFFDNTYIPFSKLRNPDLNDYPEKELYPAIWQDFYKEYSSVAKCNLTRRLNETKKNKIEAGISKTKAEKTTKLDVIVNDTYLKHAMESFIDMIMARYEIMLEISADGEVSHYEG